MRYLLGVVLPALLLSLLAYIVILMNTGNGSFIGLGVIIIAMIVIPANAIISALYLYGHRQYSLPYVLIRCYLFAAAAPFIGMFLLFL